MSPLLALLLLRQGFDTPISIEGKDVLLTSLVKEIGEKAGLTITLSKLVNTYKVTVFVKDMKAGDLLDRIGKVFDLDEVRNDKTCELLMSKATRTNFEDYEAAEQIVRMLPVRAKLDALAKFSLQPFGQTPAPSPVPVTADGSSEETPEQWAARKISRPAYYAAGLWHRASSLVRPSMWRDVKQWAAVIASGSNVEPNVFWVGVPPEPNGLQKSLTFAKAFMDEGSRGLEHTAITVGVFDTTGELRIRAVGEDDDKDEALLDRPFLFARPPKELKDMPFAKRLAAWETAVDKFPTDVLERPADATAVTPKDPGYFNGKFSLSEKLEYVHAATGIPIIASSFRTPALDQRYPEGGSAKDLVVDLTKTEQAFVRWDNGCLLVRHPAYWILLGNEPPEESILAAEKAAKTRPLTLAEYVRLAGDLTIVLDGGVPWNRVAASRIIKGPGSERGSLQGPGGYERMVGDRGFLVRFDPEPLERAYPALYLLWALPDQDRTLVAAGGKARAMMCDSTADIAPLFPTSTTLDFVTRQEWLNGAFHLHFDRATTVWLTGGSGDSYFVHLGNGTAEVAEYDFGIHAKGG